MKKLLYFSSLLLCTSALAADWDYAHQAWGTLDPAYAECQSGLEQSPINIDINAAKPNKQTTLQTHYGVANGTLVNTGKTLQINFAAGTVITVNNVQYELIQLHFHTPSEHTINGKVYPLEMHLVHKNAESKLAVIGILFEEGKQNAELSNAIQMLSKAEFNQAISIDLPALIPNNKPAFTYKGSLTTPPCSQGVSWFVVNTPSNISASQLAQYQSFYQGNARDIQKINNRNVFLMR